MRISSLARLTRAFIALVVGACFWTMAGARPLPPSLLCVDGETGEDCVEYTPPPPPVASGDGYALADALAGVPFAVATPVPPTITDEVTVTPSTIESNKVNGRRLILSPGNYGNQTFSTQDQEIVIQPGVEIGRLSIERTARRLHFRATPLRTGRIRTITTGGSWNNEITDLFFEGLYVNDNGSPSMNQFHGTRVAILSSHLIASEYAVGNFHLVNDFIMANSHAHTDSNGGGNESNMRSHSAVRYVVVDSRLQKSGASKKHALRVHGADDTSERRADYIYIARNQLDGSRVAIRGTGTAGAENGGASGASAGIGTVWFEDNVIYQPGYNNALFYTGNNTHDSDRPLMMYVRNNRGYTNRAPWFSPGQPRSNWVVSNNTVAPYQPPPDTWDFR